MPTSTRRTSRRRLTLRLLVLLSLALAATAFGALAFAPRPATPRGTQPTATFLHGRLALMLPYHSAHTGAGHLTVELLDPEDHVLGRSERSLNVASGPGSWQESLTPDKLIPFDDLVWQRVHWRFTFADAPGTERIEGTASLSEILRRPVVHILGQTQYLAGSDVALRAIVTDGTGTPDAPVDAGTFRIELQAAEDQPIVLFTGRLNHRGTVDAHFRLPANLTGRFQMRFIAETAIGTSESTQAVTLADKAAILLTTEKPLYQPGQAIHIRALALDRADHKATAAQPLTFEIEDSRGNKVFKARTRTDAFGIASAEFQLADEVNLGAYHLRALMGDPESPANTAEIALNVERYVLPKFKVAIDFTAANGKPRRDFRPGDHVTGTVHAIYFFGKPVDHAAITVKVSAMDVALFEAASTAGKTDAAGDFHFDLRLPGYFAGGPLSQGAARALVEASVIDSAAHTEARGEPITISQSGLLITAVPEGGTLIPRLENQVFVLTSYPDGTPASTILTVRAASGPVPEIVPSLQKVTTDNGGVAIIHLKPGQTVLRIDADDHLGTKASKTIELESRPGSDQILLRTDRAILKPGDRLQLHVLSTRTSGAAYVDLVRNGQTVLTRDVDLVNGQAELSVNITPEMAGTLDLDAYLFGRDSQPIADHRLVFVQPADELHIETVADAAEYKPGGEARVRFHVTNAHGQGVSAALGVQVVDEAVFALAEKQPGFAKVFFYLEQEVMKPRFEIHSLSAEQVVAPIPSPRAMGDAQPDLDARALFSATEMARPNTLDTEFGRTLPTGKQSEYAGRYQAVFLGQVQQIMARLNQHPQHAGAGSNPDKVHRDFIAAFESTHLDNGEIARDCWGNRLRVTAADRWFMPGHFSYTVASAGPDQTFDTADDLVTHLTENVNAPAPKPRATHAHPGPPTGVILEHDRGPMNNRAEITGSVLDPSGADIAGATVTLAAAPASAPRKTVTDAEGRFTFAALPAGTYEITVDAQGFTSLRQSNITLKPRDRAIVTSTLIVGSVSTTVEVASETPFVELGMPPRPVMMAMGLGRAMPMAAPLAMKARRFEAMDAVAANANVVLAEKATASDEPAAGTHVRNYFPEALYINPEILTDGHGNASITIPIADSITTWRMAMLASTQSGSLGTAAASLKVFQDFFVDLDLPVTLTQGDRVTLPVALYNYTGSAGNVALHLDQQDWFGLVGDTPAKQVNVEANRVGGASFTIEARRIGKFKLTLKAHMPGVSGAPAHDDIVVREIEVIPNGREQNLVFNGRLDGTAEHTLAFPANAIPEATTLFVRLYPGPLSQLVEGMDSILRMPYGCFEQTSSATYPNILALDYMKQSKKLTPEIHAKAEGFIATGYQRLLTFEVPGGGFSWFGEAPANKILTAYGLMEFSDMSKVAEVDPRLIERTSAWLVAQQQPDGSWKPDTRFINEGATNRFNSDVLRITAYVAWSLANSGYQGPATARAQHYIETHASQKPDPYTLAVIANFAVDNHADPDFTRRAMQALLDVHQEKDDTIFWNSEETGVYSTGVSAQIETTGLAAQALLKWGQASGPARKALLFLTQHKQADGTWGTTQATIMALRSLLLASRLSAVDTRGTVQVLIDGKPFQTLRLSAENNDLLHQFVVKNVDPSRPSVVQLRFEGNGGLAYQVAGRYFTPYESQPPAKPALAIDVVYDRAKLAENDIATATATIRNNLPQTANMIMVDLGIPPGFELLSEDLQTLQEKTANSHGGKLEKFSQTATQAILYFDGLAPGQTVTLHFRLRAKYPVRARTFQSRVYEYYDPDVSATAAPVVMEVHPR